MKFKALSVAAVIMAIMIAVSLIFSGCKSDDSNSTSVSLKEGEILIEETDENGYEPDDNVVDDPFSDEDFTDDTSSSAAGSTKAGTQTTGKWDKDSPAGTTKAGSATTKAGATKPGGNAGAGTTASAGGSTNPEDDEDHWTGYY